MILRTLGVVRCSLDAPPFSEPFNNLFGIYWNCFHFQNSLHLFIILNFEMIKQYMQLTSEIVNEKRFDLFYFKAFA
jgi:hypothetical protein